MRRSLSKLSHCSIGRPHTAPTSSISPAFSTFSGGGGGRGRGRGSDFPKFGFSPDKPEPDESKPESAPPGIGHGRGRGKPLPSSPILPSFSSFVDSPNNPPAGRGRGGIGQFSPPPQPQQQQQQQPPLRKPIFFAKEEEETADANTSSSDAPKRKEDPNLHSSIISVLTGAGRGKPLNSATAPVSEKPKEENRHLRVRQQKAAADDSGERASSPPPQRLSREDAVKKAVGILSRSDDVGGDGGGGRGMGGGFRGRGGRGAMMRGRGGRGRGRGRGRGYRREESEDGSLESGFYLGDDADGEKLAQKLGPENMNTLAEGFEEISASVLPSPMDDAYIDALHTNMMIECEPEYLMGDFESNPDIDEMPPISLRDALEKMKPFLMAYEEIKDQEEWEKVIEETMKTVPLMKEIVDYYSGPDVVTAKQQQQELERVAKTLPESAPNSVKRFTDRAVLSLQSNPGWGFDKKCQFMDKVVLEVSQHYK